MIRERGIRRIREIRENVIRATVISGGGVKLCRKFGNFMKYFSWIKLNHKCFQPGAVYEGIDN